MSDPSLRPLPQITPDTEFFWTCGKEGILRFRRCQSCKTYLHPPLPYCYKCLSQDIAVEPVSGRAKVAAFTINHQPWHPAFPPPYALALVEIDEAPYVRLTTRIVDCPFDRIKIGQAVRVVFEKVEDVWLPNFTPADVAQAAP